jgi:hypothetical protein
MVGYPLGLDGVQRIWELRPFVQRLFNRDTMQITLVAFFVSPQAPTRDESKQSVCEALLIGERVSTRSSTDGLRHRQHQALGSNKRAHVTGVFPRWLLHSDVLEYLGLHLPAHLCHRSVRHLAKNSMA